jgi:hypothetical protein
MSNNAAIRRRAGTATPNPVAQPQRNFQNTIASTDPRAMPNSNMSTPSGPGAVPNGGKSLTLQQVITLMDNRLIVLEKNSKSTSESIQYLQSSQTAVPSTEDVDVSSLVDDKLEDFIGEFNTRTELLATEINNLKQIVMNLQAYTLEINKTLMEERIRILSDIPRKETISIMTLQDSIQAETTVAEKDSIESENLVDPEEIVEKDLESNDITPDNDEETDELSSSQFLVESESQDSQLLNKKRQRASAQSGNKKSLKLSV